jgi:hypothetical protein
MQLIGRYNGEPIPFGVGPTSADYKTIGLDISWFKPWALLNGKDGKIIKSGGLSSFQRKNGKDRLSHYRKISGFDSTHNYWDLMPEHMHVKAIYEAMNSLDPLATDEFLTATLKWQRRIISVPAAVVAPSAQ